jgi:hypothetical protein
MILVFNLVNQAHVETRTTQATLEETSNMAPEFDFSNQIPLLLLLLLLLIKAILVTGRGGL